MHIRDFDLNLLHVFQAVHRAGNVSRAAEALGLSQPAVSRALTRLRLALHDPLFVRTAGGVAATPKAEQFARQVESALRLLGLESRIRLTLPHFTVAPSILAASDLAVVMPLRPARRFAARYALQVVEPDLGLPPFSVAIHWSWRARHDSGHRWLREVAYGMRFEPVPRAPRRRAALGASR